MLLWLRRSTDPLLWKYSTPQVDLKLLLLPQVILWARPCRAFFALRIRWLLCSLVVQGPGWFGDILPQSATRS